MTTKENLTINDKTEIDFSFLENFKRPKIDYIRSSEAHLVEAYQSGVYDAMMNFLGESSLKITGISETVDEVKKFFRQVSFNSELVLQDNHGNVIKTGAEQEQVAERWLQENTNQAKYTKFILMIPTDNDRNKLTRIVHEFLKTQFSANNYIFVEHTDTEIFHYHVIVEKDLQGELLRVRTDFIAVCMQHDAKIL